MSAAPFTYTRTTVGGLLSGLLLDSAFVASTAAAEALVAILALVWILCSLWGRSSTATMIPLMFAVAELSDRNQVSLERMPPPRVLFPFYVDIGGAASPTALHSSATISSAVILAGIVTLTHVMKIFPTKCLQSDAPSSPPLWVGRILTLLCYLNAPVASYFTPGIVWSAAYCIGHVESTTDTLAPFGALFLCGYTHWHLWGKFHRPANVLLVSLLNPLEQLWRLDRFLCILCSSNTATKCSSQVDETSARLPLHRRLLSRYFFVETVLFSTIAALMASAGAFVESADAKHKTAMALLGWVIVATLWGSFTSFHTVGAHKIFTLVGLLTVLSMAVVSVFEEPSNATAKSQTYCIVVLFICGVLYATLCINDRVRQHRYNGSISIASPTATASRGSDDDQSPMAQFLLKPVERPLVSMQPVTTLQIDDVTSVEITSPPRANPPLNANTHASQSIPPPSPLIPWWESPPLFVKEVSTSQTASESGNERSEDVRAHQPDADETTSLVTSQSTHLIPWWESIQCLKETSAPLGEGIAGVGKERAAPHKKDAAVATETLPDTHSTIAPCPLPVDSNELIRHADAMAERATIVRQYKQTEQFHAAIGQGVLRLPLEDEDEAGSHLEPLPAATRLGKDGLVSTFETWRRNEALRRATERSEHRRQVRALARRGNEGTGEV